MRTIQTQNKGEGQPKYQKNDSTNPLQKENRRLRLFQQGFSFYRVVAMFFLIIGILETLVLGFGWQTTIKSWYVVSIFIPFYHYLVGVTQQLLEPLLIFLTIPAILNFIRDVANRILNREHTQDYIKTRIKNNAISIFEYYTFLSIFGIVYGMFVYFSLIYPNPSRITFLFIMFILYALYAFTRFLLSIDRFIYWHHFFYARIYFILTNIQATPSLLGYWAEYLKTVFKTYINSGDDKNMRILYAFMLSMTRKFLDSIDDKLLFDRYVEVWDETLSLTTENIQQLKTFFPQLFKRDSFSSEESFTQGDAKLIIWGSMIYSLAKYYKDDPGLVQLIFDEGIDSIDQAKVSIRSALQLFAANCIRINAQTDKIAIPENVFNDIKEMMIIFSSTTSISKPVIEACSHLTKLCFKDADAVYDTNFIIEYYQN